MSRRLCEFVEYGQTKEKVEKWMLRRSCQLVECGQGEKTKLYGVCEMWYRPRRSGCGCYEGCRWWISVSCGRGVPGGTACVRWVGSGQVVVTAMVNMAQCCPAYQPTYPPNPPTPLPTIPPTQPPLLATSLPDQPASHAHVNLWRRVTPNPCLAPVTRQNSPTRTACVAFSPFSGRKQIV